MTENMIGHDSKSYVKPASEDALGIDEISRVVVEAMEIPYGTLEMSEKIRAWLRDEVVKPETINMYLAEMLTPEETDADQATESSASPEGEPASGQELFNRVLVDMLVQQEMISAEKASAAIEFVNQVTNDMDDLKMQAMKGVLSRMFASPLKGSDLGREQISPTAK